MLPTLLAALVLPAFATPPEGVFTVTSTAHDDEGNAYVVSYFEGEANEELLVMKLDREGVILWSSTFADQDFGRSIDVSVDPLGGVIVSGTFTGAIVIGDERIESEGPRDLFVVRFSADGYLDWSRRLNTPADAAPPKASPGRLRVVFVGGGWGQVWVDGDPLDVTAPFSSHALEPGVHQIAVENPVVGSRHVENVVITPAQTTTVHVPQPR